MNETMLARNEINIYLKRWRRAYTLCVKTSLT